MQHAPLKQAPDEIMIVAETPARAEALKQAITLRGFDEIVCLDVQGAPNACQKNPPALVVVDMGGDLAKTLRLLEALPTGINSIVLSDVFDEAFFVACHDRGARDFLIKPVPEAVLVSRVIRNLQEHRLAQVSDQKDQILVEMGVLSAQSGVFTTSYLINLLRRHTEGLSATDSMALLIVQMEGHKAPLSAEAERQLLSTVGATIKDCARGLDVVGEYFLDKFAVIMPQTTRRGARALANRLQQRLNGLEFSAGRDAFTLTVRVGAAEYNGCRHYEDLLNRALEEIKANSGKPNPPVVDPGQLKPV